jgi:hypothetical protein
MKTIVLQEPKLVEELEQVAAEQNITAENLLTTLASQFLYKTALQKMQAETAAFEQMHSQLVSQHLGEYVAVHNKQVVDHDSNINVLRARIRQRFGRMPILLRQVTPEIALRELVFRSPRLTSPINTGQ